jgi:hypothetical protein
MNCHKGTKTQSKAFNFCSSSRLCVLVAKILYRRVGTAHRTTINAGINQACRSVTTLEFRFIIPVMIWDNEPFNG